MWREWVRRREKQEREHFLKLNFPKQKSKLLRLPKDWDMMPYFVSDGNSTLWWITSLFHNFLQNNIGKMLQNLQATFRISSSDPVFFLIWSICPNWIHFIAEAAPIPNWVLWNKFYFQKQIRKRETWISWINQISCRAH